jgi:hypothetical protein
MLFHELNCFVVVWKINCNVLSGYSTWKAAQIEKIRHYSPNKTSIYSVYKFFTDIPQQHEHFSNINVHIKQLKGRKVPNYSVALRGEAQNRQAYTTHKHTACLFRN